MRFLKALSWIEKIKNIREFKFKEDNLGLEIDLFNLEIEKGLAFEIFHPFVKILYNNPKFIISDNSFSIKINHFRINQGTNLLSRKIIAYNFQNIEFNGEEFFYFRLLSPLKDSFYLVNLLNISPERTYKIKINKNSVKLSIENSEIKKYLVIESVNKITFSDFKHLSNSLLFALGFLNGDLIKDEELFFQTNDETWEDINGFFYRELNKSIKCFKPINSIPQQYSNFINDKEYDFDSKKSILELNNLEKLINSIHNNNHYFTAIRILLEINNNSFVTKPSILFVVLEILCEEINKEHKSDYIEKQKLKDEALNVLRGYKEKINICDYDFLNKVIYSLDKKLVKNLVNFERAFNSLGIKLNKNDSKVLEKRNDFFHGRILSQTFSFKNEEEYTEIELEYYSISQRLFTLISKLLLKSIDYSGYIVNHQKLREKQSNKEIDEDYFIKI